MKKEFKKELKSKIQELEEDHESHVENMKHEYMEQIKELNKEITKIKDEYEQFKSNCSLKEMQYVLEIQRQQQENQNLQVTLNQS